jgi:isopentenyl-diphosphate delta-isomerase
VNRQEQDQQMLLVVDEDDAFRGRYVVRGMAHTGHGEHHRAFVCLVLDGSGRVLLQKRRHWLWDDLWDCAAVSHVLHVNGRDESYEEATVRTLDQEMGIRGATPAKVAGFNYFARHPVGDGCENEYCAVMVARYEGEIRPDPERVYDHRWVEAGTLRAEISQQPEAFTPWARLAVETLEQTRQWPPMETEPLSPGGRG